MNAYVLDGGSIKTVNDVIDGYYLYEWGGSVELVFADTRSQAKATYIKHYAQSYMWGHEFEYTDPIRIKLVAKNVDRSRGVAASDDALWFECDPSWIKWLELEPNAKEDYYRDYPAVTA